MPGSGRKGDSVRDGRDLNGNQALHVGSVAELNIAVSTQTARSPIGDNSAGEIVTASMAITRVSVPTTMGTRLRWMVGSPS